MSHVSGVLVVLLLLLLLLLELRVQHRLCLCACMPPLQWVSRAHPHTAAPAPHSRHGNMSCSLFNKRLATVPQQSSLSLTYEGTTRSGNNDSEQAHQGT
jgi:hypothetical protein